MQMVNFFEPVMHGLDPPVAVLRVSAKILECYEMVSGPVRPLDPSKEVVMQVKVFAPIRKRHDVSIGGGFTQPVKSSA